MTSSYEKRSQTLVRAWVLLWHLGEQKGPSVLLQPGSSYRGGTDVLRGSTAVWWVIKRESILNCKLRNYLSFGFLYLNKKVVCNKINISRYWKIIFWSPMTVIICYWFRKFDFLNIMVKKWQVKKVSIPHN